MGLRISFDLDDEDLQHFQLIMREARKAAACMAPEDILAAAEEVLSDIDGAAAPGFVRERLDKLRTLIAMLSDLEWRLPHDDGKRVLNALAYLAETEDLIPDHIPGIGFLDDAIMIELVVRELRPEIEAYVDFCNYREELQTASGSRLAVSRGDWLDNRRDALLSRMRRRRKKARKDRAKGRNPELLN
ncbi:MAG: DUF1232 domain-containing protein [Pseudomonadota bacterium]